MPSSRSTRARAASSTQDGKPVALQIQAGEKVYQDFALDASDVGGHSSRPTKNNPIVRLAGRHRQARRPRLSRRAQRGDTGLLRGAVEARRARESPPTCTPCCRTRADEAGGGAAVGRQPGLERHAAHHLRRHRDRRRPRAERACRSTRTRTSTAGSCRACRLPTVQAEIVRVLADDKIAVAPTGDTGMQSPPPPLDARIMGPVRTVAERIWPGVAIVPTMSTGATDGRFLNAHGTPTYGLSGMFHDAEGPARARSERAHPRRVADERPALPLRGRQAVREPALDAGAERIG